MNADDVDGDGPEQQQIDGDEEYDDREHTGYGVRNNGGHGDDPRRNGKWADRTPSNYSQINSRKRQNNKEAFNPDAQYYGPGDSNYPSSLKKSKYAKNGPNAWPRTKGQV